jgi:hypothetical protein
MDAKSSFLNGDLFEEIFMEYPIGFLRDSNLFFLLHKSLYVLKQTTRAWCAKIDRFFLNLRFKCCESNRSLYVLHDNGDTLIVVVYVIDLVITGNNLVLILILKRQLVETFDMKNIGLLHYFLDLQFLPLSDGFFLSQYKYVLDLLNHFNMTNYKPYATPFRFMIEINKDCQYPKVD